MPLLILEHSGKRKRTALNARASIGRTPNNDVVIEHPAVSRTHAIIECDGGAYFIADAGSKNGTLVDDHIIKQKRLLSDGDRISIGPAVLTFHASDDFVESSTQATLTETHAGMLMDCECGAKLWVPKELIGGRGQCQKCGRSLLLSPQQSRAHAGKVCSICQWKIEAADTAHTCPACGLVVHAECWQENRGCSAYGCSQVGILDKPEEVDAAMEEIGHPPVLPVTPLRTFPWEFALLAASVVASLLGLLLFGTLALVTLLASGVFLLKQGRRCRVPVLLSAMGLSLAGLVAGVVVSCFWWLNLHLR